ncbi:MAG: hypothetical protein IPP71_09995 [Bacteroidetes bacterium]|nr:hypothetical protein [Bacteroidota bacterium]
MSNHRSYPEILHLSNQILQLPPEQIHLSPIPLRIPESDFITNYAQIVDVRESNDLWWNQISVLMNERIGQRLYNQIAILLRTNNEVYRGFQKIKSLNLSNVRIRIQGIYLMNLFE